MFQLFEQVPKKKRGDLFEARIHEILNDRVRSTSHILCDAITHLFSDHFTSWSAVRTKPQKRNPTYEPVSGIHLQNNASGLTGPTVADVILKDGDSDTQYYLSLKDGDGFWPIGLGISEHEAAVFFSSVFSTPLAERVLDKAIDFSKRHGTGLEGFWSSVRSTIYLQRRVWDHTVHYLNPEWLIKSICNSFWQEEDDEPYVIVKRELSGDVVLHLVYEGFVTELDAYLRSLTWGVATSSYTTANGLYITAMDRHKTVITVDLRAGVKGSKPGFHVLFNGVPLPSPVSSGIKVSSPN
jgi:hypothetical protein